MEFGRRQRHSQLGDVFQNYSANIMGNYQKFYYMAGYESDNHDGFVEYGAEKNYSFFTKLGYNFSDKTYLDFLYNQNKIGYQNHQFFDDTQEGLPPDFPYLWNHNRIRLSDTHVFAQILLPCFSRAERRGPAQILPKDDVNNVSGIVP